MRRELLDLWRRLLESEEPFVRATVVRRRPPTSSRLGDTAVVTRDGELHGWIGGSCTTPTVIRHALESLDEGRPRLLAFGFDEAGRTAADVIRIPMTCQSGGSVEVYIEPVIPAPRLLVVGASPISQAIARIGHAMGWSVTRVEPGTQGEVPASDEGPSGDDVDDVADLEDQLAERPPSSRLFALVATMGRADERTVTGLLALRPEYLGVIASPKRMDEIRRRLAEHGVDAEQLERLRGPAGLDLGGTTPEEIAVSVVAEMVQVHRSAAATRSDSERSSPADIRGDWARDPVCGMEVEADGTRPSVEHRGKLYFFCCEGCRDRFAADPDAYAGADPGTGTEADAASRGAS